MCYRLYTRNSLLLDVALRAKLWLTRLLHCSNTSADLVKINSWFTELGLEIFVQFWLQCSSSLGTNVPVKVRPLKVLLFATGRLRLLFQVSENIMEITRNSHYVIIAHHQAS